MGRIAIYTCIVGKYDTLLQPEVVRDGFDFICFVGEGEEHPASDGVWQIRELSVTFGKPGLDSRYPKMHPHVLLPEYECSVWIDGNILIRDDTIYKAARAKEEAGVIFSGVPHPTRDCVYEEARKCRDMRYISNLQLLKVWVFLFLHGVPRHCGMLEANLIFRRHNDPKVIRFDEMWWNKVVRFIPRDQLTQTWCLRKCGIEKDCFLPDGQSTRNNAGFRYVRHGEVACSDSGTGVDVSIVIVCMNKPGNLRPCLDSLIRTTTVPYEILVVAYMFDKAVLSEIRKEYPSVKFIVNDTIAGFSANNNLALRQVAGRFCFIVNDDTETDCMLVDTLARDFKSLPEDTAIVSPVLLNADGSLQLAGRPDFKATQFVAEHWHLYREHKDDTVGKAPVEGLPSVYRTSNICGAAFLIRTDVFRSLGWFDERYFFTPEDIALSTLARRKGYKVYVDTSVSIIHKSHVTAVPLYAATKPAGLRGFLIFFSEGSAIKYFALAVPVWLAEFSKLVKAGILNLFSPSEEKRIEIRYLSHNICSIFTGKSPKDIFLRYAEIFRGN